jgi:HK97 family phage prohead protease
MLVKRSFPVKLKSVEMKDEDGSSVGEFSAVVAVFGNRDRGGDIIERGAFKRTLEERGLPPIIYSHRWEMPPIGVASRAEETDEGLEIDGRLFVDENQTAKETYVAMREGALKEFSFAYEPLEFETRSGNEEDEEKGEGEEEETRHLLDVELFEVGPTLVGMNPATRLIEVRSRQEKRVIPFRETSKAPDDTSWDAAAEVARADVADLFAMSAWVDTSIPDEDGDGLPDGKTAYKLPHHRASESHPVVWRGVASAMAVLLGARGGIAAIPPGDRAGVHSHLSSHYRQFDREPPELRAYTRKELVELVPEAFEDEFLAASVLFR